MKATQRHANDNEAWLAHRIFINGIEHPLSIAKIKACNGRWEISVDKFSREVHSTSFHSGTIRIIQENPEENPLLIFE